jgi:hypothetical protein
MVAQLRYQLLLLPPPMWVVGLLLATPQLLQTHLVAQHLPLLAHLRQYQLVA